MRRGRWGVGVVTGGVVLLLMWLVTAPGVRLFNPPQIPLRLPRMPQEERHYRPAPTVRPTGSTLHTQVADATRMSPVSAWLWTVFAALFLLAAVACVVVWVVRELRALRAEAHVDETQVETLPEVPESLLAEPDVFRRTLAEGEPRNAIVACWARLEDATAEAGVPMAAHETSSEYTARVVGAWVSEPVSIERMAQLYRVARFSAHELTEADRAAAGEALDALLRDLRRTWEVRRGTR